MTILSKVLRLLVLPFQQHTLSSAEASLWCREAGEREKKKALGMMGRGKRERKGFSLFPSSPARYLFFDYCYFYRPGGASAEERGQRNQTSGSCVSLFRSPGFRFSKITLRI